MKAVQITQYAKQIHTVLSEVEVPQIGPNEVLVQVKAAAVNPLELLILTGSVKLIQDYAMPLTLGNECAGIVEKVGAQVTGFAQGDRVYARLPLEKIGAFAQYVAVDQGALAPMPAGYDFMTAAAIPLAGLTAWQGLHEELEVRPGGSILITGGSGSFGQLAVPLAKSMGLHVIVSGNARARESVLAAGADEYLDYRKERYWEQLTGLDYVLDTLGAGEFAQELSVLKEGGRLLSLRTGPNRAFAVKNHFSPAKRLLFSLAGLRYDRAAQKQGKEYRFLFVRADGRQLREITRIVETQKIVPKVHPKTFSLQQADEALQLVAQGHPEGKVILEL